MKRVTIVDDESCGSKSASSFSGSKRRRKLSFSEDEDSRLRGPDSPPMSKIYNSAYRNNKPAELFRKDLISAMKLPDSEQLDPKDFWFISDSWKQEWERGVQVPVNSKNMPLPKVIDIKRRVDLNPCKMPKKFILIHPEDRFPSETHIALDTSEKADKVCRYDMDDLDSQWLEVFNEMRDDYGLLPVSEETFEVLMEDFESQCFNKFQEALQTEEGLGIEYDEDVICDVCRVPECEEGNEMVFCDSCNICVHQACYGITAIPEGSWVCRTCAQNVVPSCVLCPNKGGAMKSTKSGDMWAHVSCALWVPEVTILDPEKMEPIGNISQIPTSRWALICTFCRERNGACIQCCVKQCKVAYHVTCAFEHGLEMNAVYSEFRAEDGVKLRSYCLKHSDQSKETQPDNNEGTAVLQMKSIVKKEGKSNKISDFDKHNARLQKIREMEAEFHQYVEINHAMQLTPGADHDTVDQIYHYWKLKRTSNFNKPLLPTKFDEAALLGKQPEDSDYARMKMFVHLRQDLERVRNLCYMVGRRDKIRRSYIAARKDVFLKQVELVNAEILKLGSKEYKSVMESCKGNTVIDKMYSDHCKLKKEKQENENPMEKEKDADNSKKKLVSAARLPNPYAKLYFSDIHTRSRNGTSKVTTTGTYCMRRKNLKKSQSLENVGCESTAKTDVDIGRKRASISSPVVIKDEVSDNDPLIDFKAGKQLYTNFAISEALTKTENAEQKMKENMDSSSVKQENNSSEAQSEEQNIVFEEVAAAEKPQSNEDVNQGANLEDVSERTNFTQDEMVDVPVNKVDYTKEKPCNEVMSLAEIDTKKVPSTCIETTEQDSQDANKENLSVVLEMNGKNIVTDQSLTDIKNSPSQSDKENVITHPKSRGRKPKSQHDTKSGELVKAIEELSIEGKVEKHDKNRDCGNFKNVPSADGLKTTITRTSRYEMRARKQVLSVPHDATTEDLPEKLPLAHEQPITALKMCDEEPPTIDKMDEDNFGNNEDSRENDKEVIELIARDNSTARRIRLSVKRITRNKHPPDRAKVMIDSDNSDGEKDCDEPNFREYKMSLRQNGKVLLSPVKKQVSDLQGRDSLPLKDAHNEGLKKEKCKRDDFSPVHSNQPHSSASGNKLPVSPNRDVTSSPRLVIRLVKDPDCKQWQKDTTISPNAPTSFKVVRNDWEDIESSNDAHSLKDCNPEVRERKPIRTTLKNTVKLHRYSMRERPKRTSTNS